MSPTGEQVVLYLIAERPFGLAPRMVQSPNSDPFRETSALPVETSNTVA